MASEESTDYVPQASQHLLYIENSDQFKWDGTFDELSKFIVFLFGSGNGGTSSEDRTHKLFTFKVDDVMVKWYSTTHTIVIQGTGHKLLKKKLFEERQKSGQAQTTPVEDEDDGTTAPITLRTVMLRVELRVELRVMKQEMADIKELLSPGVAGSTIVQNLEALRNEKSELRSEIKIHKDNLR